MKEKINETANFNQLKPLVYIIQNEPLSKNQKSKSKDTPKSINRNEFMINNNLVVKNMEVQNLNTLFKKSKDKFWKFQVEQKKLPILSNQNSDIHHRTKMKKYSTISAINFDTKQLHSKINENQQNNHTLINNNNNKNLKQNNNFIISLQIGTNDSDDEYIKRYLLNQSLNKPTSENNKNDLYKSTKSATKLNPDAFSYKKNKQAADIRSKSTESSLSKNETQTADINFFSSSSSDSIPKKWQSKSSTLFQQLKNIKTSEEKTNSTRKETPFNKLSYNINQKGVSQSNLEKSNNQTKILTNSSASLIHPLDNSSRATNKVAVLGSSSIFTTKFSSVNF